jgi:hypothetical protein
MTDTPRVPREELLRRVSGEFLEMPGLRLTCEQAQRLWGLDRDTCVEVLSELVATSFLTRAADGQYGRATEVSSVYPRPRMAQANLDSTPFAIKRVS